MANVICTGDLNINMGVITAIQSYVFIMGMAITTDGSPVTVHPLPCPPDPCLHPATGIGNSTIVKIDGMPIITSLSQDRCFGSPICQRKPPMQTIVTSQ